MTTGFYVPFLSAYSLWAPGKKLKVLTLGLSGVLTGLLLVSLTAHKCSQQVEGKARALSVLLCQQENYQKLALFSKESTKPVPGRRGHKDNWPVRDGARENQEQDAGYLRGHSHIQASSCLQDTVVLLSLPGPNLRQSADCLHWVICH